MEQRYLTVKKATEKWKISNRRVRALSAILGGKGLNG